MESVVVDILANPAWKVVIATAIILIVVWGLARWG
jgi:hypothetical protein